MQSKTIHVLKNSRVAGLPLAVYLILLAVTIAAAAMGALPDNMLGAMLLLMVLGVIIVVNSLRAYFSAQKGAETAKAAV